MNQATPETRSVVVERELPHPPEKVWRALTQPHLLEAWLMKSDFAPVAGHAFSFSADWGAVDCKVLTIEPHRMLSYTWAAYGLDSVVTWTLTPTPAGTLLRMEQAGFRADQEQAYRGAQHGWARFLESLEQVLARPDAHTEARS
ncbi:SRPBCC domain-containing protein [Pseudomonas aeruginosa]|uniref:SRPBCC family protein n=1 Tax=Burkholderia multivorans TaxID=87883 RepID=UPI001C2468B1|nr:SRPBCC domain-containing protein [Burkholderia multivorans]MCO2636939.1 SRPBCC domain-containing protein [Pseudomonas aeruginosa]MBU9223520.1 SRPBCC domain-containing protein [Burkholderia multivorans]MBU9418025.1 SRPBCC domain-containing protein [Burkholderia multivorans]MCA8411323.1 SRPBCC domain-containing protein [Burkholderia multivorans]MDI3305291.1 SRPBCC domain-containing protein [Burkholderia multivorans]